MRRAFILAAVVCVLASSALAVAPGTPGSDSSKPVPRSIFVVGDTGDATHVQTQWQCPAAFGDFRRDDLHVYDAFGLDVDCDYKLAGEITITLYLTKRTGGDLKADFEGGKQAITGRFNDATLLPDAEQKSFPSGFDWLHAIFAIQGGAIHSGIWYAWFGDWEYEIRASYPAGREDMVMATLAQMTDSARPTAAHLARCAQSSAPARDGKPITDDGQLSSMAMMATIALVAQPVAAPTEWCAEAPAPDTSVPILLWHALNPDGSTAPFDRAVLMTYEDPPVLDSAANPELATILAEIGKSTNQPNSGRPPYTITMTRGDTTTIYGFSDGRPDASALARILADYQNGKARALASYDAAHKKVTIVTPPSP